MKNKISTLRQINIIAFVICILFYLTCYARFTGQIFLSFVQIFSAIGITIPFLMVKDQSEIKKRIKIYWLVTILNALLLFSFFKTIMWNDLLQVVFVNIIPSITAVYFIRTLSLIEKIS
ncbi:hypothetical protein ACFSJW_15790 [Flavobacterium artemisiae]|uniref:Uncharacterized protein n=1 Tax=Flavobacterium artemisiae TaxID=2126556 RepID=A0ABW4H890_9FLAO